MNDMKLCTKCGEKKPTSEFYKNKAKKDGLTTECGECNRKYSAYYRAKNGARPKPTSEAARRYNLKASFGITPEDWEWLYAGQNGQCAICGDDIHQIGTQQSTPDRKAAVTDHCHRTGVIRGLLCSPCNIGIGSLRDDPALVISAYAYLNFFRELSHAPDLRVGPRDERTS